MYLRGKLSQNKQLTTKFDNLAQIANISCSHYNSLPVDFGIDLAFFYSLRSFHKTDNERIPQHGSHL